MSEKHAAGLRLWLAQPALGPKDAPPLLMWGAAVIAAAILPLFVGPWLLSTVRDALVMGILALSYDLLWGRAGVLTLGHTTFLGLGAYGFAVATVQFGQAPVTGLAAGCSALRLSPQWWVISCSLRA